MVIFCFLIGQVSLKQDVKAIAAREKKILGQSAQNKAK